VVKEKHWERIQSVLKGGKPNKTIESRTAYYMIDEDYFGK
jgi:hypothetical protein